MSTIRSANSGISPAFLSLQILRHSRKDSSSTTPYDDNLYFDPSVLDKKEYEDFSHFFQVDIVFGSREELINWAKETAVSHCHRLICQSRRENAQYMTCDKYGHGRQTNIDVEDPRNSGTKKCGCPFKLIGKRSRFDELWRLTVSDGRHSHRPTLFPHGQGTTSRITPQQKARIKELRNSHVKPMLIMDRLRKDDPTIQTSMKHVYNELAKIKSEEMEGMTVIQFMMHNFQKGEYRYWHRVDSETSNTITDIISSVIAGRTAHQLRCSGTDQLAPSVGNRDKKVHSAIIPTPFMTSTSEVARNLSSLLEGELTPLPGLTSNQETTAGGPSEEPTPGVASTTLEKTGTTITLTMEHLQALISAVAQSKPPEVGGGGNMEKRKPESQPGMSAIDDELLMLPSTESEGMAGTPFTSRLQHGELPATYRPVTYEYTGATDPWEHVSRFVTSASLHRLTDGVKCRVFATTLAGPAQRWFSQLPQGSVDGFTQFSELFLNHFASSKKQKRSTLTLFAVRQREGEPLRNYVQRFNAATLEVPVTSEEVLINALAQEEARRSRTSEPAPTNDKRRDKNRVEVKKQEPFSRREVGTERRTGPRFENYAPLSTAPSEILTAIVNHPKLKWPRTYSETPKKPVSAGPYCRFHNEHGHSTDECQHLRDEIERLIRTKNLSEFVESGPGATAKYPRKGGNGGAQAPNRQGKDADLQPPNNYIHTIFGGPAGGDSNRSRRAHLRELQELRGELAMMYRVSVAPPITFGVEDETGIQQPHNDALVITAMVANYDVARILVDTGSSADIIYYECFRQMRLNFEVRKVDTALIGFAGEVVQPMGEVTLPVSLGTDPLKATRAVRFLIIDAPSTYNMIMGRPSMNAFEAVVSTFHMKMKFPVLDRVGEVRGDQETSRRCYNQALRGQRRINPVGWDKGNLRPGSDDIGRAEEKRPRLDPEEKEEAHVQPMEELKVIQLDVNDPTRTTRIGTTLNEEMREELTTFLRNNQDVFAWSPKDLRGIDPAVMVHELNLRPGVSPVKQKRRHFGPEKDKIIEGEVRKLLEAGHIREIKFPTWLSNAVLVKKAEGKWRMCIDFRDLNRACPKDHYPLPRIDQLVDSTAGCAMLSMMDASQGYHQIRLNEGDQSNVSFVTSTGTYCYVVMPFGLKNAGATYQRLVDRMFRGQLGRNMEVYVDDMLVKREEAGNHIQDLRETFGTLRRYGMKLNPLKCAFGVEA
ncbi:PREDICTED: uncharacterized protein LOC105958118 [Erythranthe guttata]|uniref:uncharacterized protein LOC105958118 n=1 Tax=Erythranthe guttata TaxID=4155 RepID=UPI00064D86A1|nr:PREDICTED: uncharacterized protein LOC105958118 [Erythranthe guttata]|eukprot:XP_012837573.1 PREDICTED: uncharacterized protein LOC105958118 [Erythranthe guttata]